MKKLIFSLFFLSVSILAIAQEDDETRKKLKRENWYIGSGINVGFVRGWILGLNPETGYSVGKFLDVGVATNFNYITQNLGTGQTYRFTALGAGPYVRGWIANRFFLTSQFEYNFIRETFVSNGVKNIDKYNAPSLLVGGGWGNRFIGQSQFFTSIMIDVLKDPESPYLDRGTNTLLPVFRTGFLFYFQPKKERNR
jgi:hypothetical protein